MADTPTSSPPSASPPRCNKLVNGGRHVCRFPAGHDGDCHAHVNAPFPPSSASEANDDGPWRCFYCDEVFTSEQDAEEHFGAQRGSLAGCQLKGHEHGLLRIVREQEEELAQHRSENTEFIRTMETLKSEQADEVRRAEELGYGRAVREMQRLAKLQFGSEVNL